MDKISEGVGLPILSPIALRLRELSSNETASVDDLVSLMAKDPSLATRLLRLANAAFFGNAGQITTIDHAVMRVGFRRIRDMALSITLKDTFPLGKVGPMDYEGFWRSSLYRAIIAQGLATTSYKTCNPDEAFVAGLTLEIGLLILFDLFIKGKKDTMPPPYPFQALIEWEQEQFGLNHRELGCQALKFWNFPPTIIECQDLSLDEKRYGDAPPLALLCDVARRFSYLISEKEAIWHPILTEVEMIGGITTSEFLSPVLVTAFTAVEEIAATLQVKINREGDLVDLLEKLNITLQQITVTISNWIFFIFDPNGGSGSQLLAQYSLTEKLQLVAKEIRKPVEIIRDFIDTLTPSISPDSKEWSHVEAIAETVRKVELAAMLMK
ncbi:MAG: HDOD domain-containing protein [Dissulfurispiraceae bacterium]